MKMIAYLLAIICVIAAVMYFVMPAGQLPTFMPGYLAGSSHIHTTHAIAAAVAGFGITSTSGWACSRELEDGLLVRLFLDWKMAGIPVHAYFPMGSATRAAGRVAVDHLVAEFRRSADVLSP